MEYNIKDIVKDQKAIFLYYIDGNLWYTTENGFKFPIPIDDTKGACFNRDHKAITLMRWIRKHIKVLSEGKKTPYDYQVEVLENGDQGC